MHEFEKLALTLNGNSREKIRAANRAILAAIISFAEEDDPAAHILLGMTAEAFDMIKSLSKRDVERLSNIEVPIWTSRFDLGPRMVAGEPAPVLDRDHLVHSMLKTFANLDIPR